MSRLLKLSIIVSFLLILGFGGFTPEGESQAAAVSLDLLVRPARRGPLPLIVGLALMALYLVFFRDVLKPTEGK